MSTRVTEINPNILRWARVRAGFSTAEVGLVLKKDSALIEAWENGLDFPSYAQLEKLAYQVYKRPLAIFFFPLPPEEPDLKESFRTLPPFEKEKLASDTLLALRQASSNQISLKELNDGINTNKKKIFTQISISYNSSLIEATKSIRDFLEVSLEQQTRYPNSEIALKEWRRVVEKNGIFIFKRSFKQKDISGFSLVDEEFPIIYLNNSSSDNRQIFTIFHELAHILLRSNGITKADTSYIETLIGTEKEIEIFCNRFAAEFLVPSEDFNKKINNTLFSEGLVANLAKLYKVSKEVILRKFLDREIIASSFYELKVSEWNKDYLTFKSKTSGGNYYSTKATYLGDSFLNLAFGKYYQGKCSVEQLAEHLSIKVTNIPNLENIVLSKG